MAEQDQDMDEQFDPEDDAFADSYEDEPVFEDEDGEFFEDELLEGGEFEDEWDTLEEDYDGFEEEPSDQPSKKSKPNLVIVGGGVLAAIAVFYFVLGGGDTPAPTPQPTPVKNVAKAPGPPETQTDLLYGKQKSKAPEVLSPAQRALREKGLINDPDALEEITQIREQFEFQDARSPASEPPPAETTQQKTGQPAPRAPETPGQAEEVLTPMPDTAKLEDPSKTAKASSRPAPKEETVLKETPEQKTDQQTRPALETDKNRTPENQPVSDTMAAGDLAALSTKIDSLISKFETMRSEVETLKDTTQDRFGSLSNRMDSLDSKIKTVSTKLGAMETKRSAAKQEASRTASAGKTSPTSKVEKEPAQKPGQKSQPAQKPAATADIWVLKGARPGQAIVSRKGSGETYTIAPGESLKGLGIVQSVQKENGIWTVRASNGIIQP